MKFRVKNWNWEITILMVVCVMHAHHTYAPDQMALLRAEQN